MLESALGQTHAWSIMTAEGEQSIKLDSLEEGNTRLAACMPLPESLRRGVQLYHLLGLQTTPSIQPT